MANRSENGDLSPRAAREALSRLAPRPLVLVSTLGPDGAPNLAPFSMATPLSAEPPLVGVAILPRSDGGQKRTLSNLEATDEFVLNLVTLALLDAALSPSGRAALPLLPSERVAPPRVAGSPAQF